MVDDMGYGGVSSFANQYYQTPEIDRLAAEGLQLMDYHSNGVVCTPTRASLMTGLYPQRTGSHLVFNASPEHEDYQRGLPKQVLTFPEALKQSGYVSAIFGKWHLGYKAEFNPLNHGFDQFNGFISGNIDAHFQYDRVGTFDWWQNDKLNEQLGYHSDLITDNTLEFIENNKDKPFFIYVSHGAPHDPLQARGSKIKRGPNKGKVPKWGIGQPTYSEKPGDNDWLMQHIVLAADEGVGKIRQQVERLGLADNTIIWFVSDNGGTTANHTVSELTRGKKADLYEGGHRVPGIVWAPKMVKPGISNALVTSMDIMPTNLVQANVILPKELHLDGIDLGPVLFEHKAQAERTIFWGNLDKKKGVVVRNGLALRQGSWKLVNDELYDLSSDPQEKHNIAQQYPQKLQAMQKEVKAMFNNALRDSPYDN